MIARRHRGYLIKSKSMKQSDRLAHLRDKRWLPSILVNLIDWIRYRNYGKK